MVKPVEETIYLSEQRRFRRLEVSLPVWIASEKDFNASGQTPWSLGYTRDISMGGSKVIVPDGEEARWREMASRGAGCLLRFDERQSGSGYISARVIHAAREAESGRLWLGIEYEDGAHDEKSAALRAGLSTVKTRRRWQGIAALACVALLLGGAFIMKLRGDVQLQRNLVAQKEKARKKISFQISQLSRGGLVSTRAQGIDGAFAREKAEKLMKRLNGDIKRLNDPSKQQQIESERAARNAAQGLTLSNVAAGVSNVNFGIALPYGYAWPQVTDDLEQLLGRSVPTVVIFRDWTADFPLADAREAKARAKTLQITWEPWKFSDPKAFSLDSIIVGKHDAYIDRFANAARSFGSEIWLRYAHEFNGNWYPWSVSASGKNPAKYIAAFRHVHDRFTRAGAFNVRWVWCLNAESVPDASWNDPLRAYPGDAYVDMISMDGYNFGSTLSNSRWQSFQEIFAAPYSRLTRKFPRKPLMIGEVGCATVGGPTGGDADKADWIYAMDDALRKQFPRISGVVWFEAQKEADWRMASSVSSLQASRKVWNAPYYRRGES